jgi:nitrite reductase (NADH) large subunit
MSAETQAPVAANPPRPRSLPKRLAGRLAPRRPGPQAKPETLVIIGNGPAAFRLCERLTTEPARSRFRVIVVGEEPQPAYDRVRLTELISGKPEASLQFAPLSWYEENQIDLRPGDPAVAVDVAARVVRTGRGHEIPFDRLVFATGSRAFLPDIPGARLPGVFVYRTAEDLRRILARAAESRRAAVIGGGLLGLEAAVALRSLGLETWVIERGVSVLARHLDPEAGSLLGAHLQRARVGVITGRETERIEALDNDLLLQFSNGECLRVHLAIFAIGIRPRDELAVAARLRSGPRGGIHVDDHLQTSAPGVYAIGECASHRGVIYGLAAPAYQMAEVLADNLVGRARAFEGADSSAWLKVPELTVAALGQHQAELETLTWRSPAAFRRIVLDRGRIVGAVNVGEWPEQQKVHAAILQRQRVWSWQRSRFLRSGALWRRRPPQPVREWPADAIVCACRVVRRGTLSEACAAGCVTVAQLARETGASTVCGSCAPLLAQLAGAPDSPPAPPGRRRLLAASIAALAFAVLIVFARPIPFSASAQTPGLAELLWTDSATRQITGFTTVGLTLVGLLFSARKRIRKFTAGHVGIWKAIHAILGAATLVALVSHTGFRLGANLNRVLMLNFLALAAVGALAGAVTALEHRVGGPMGRRLRAAWSAAHIALAWPLPILLIVHVVTAYYF